MSRPTNFFTLEELRQAFTKLVYDLSSEQLEELRAWLEERVDRKLETADAIALAWIKVTAGELRRRADEAIRQLEPAGETPGASSKHLAPLSPPRRNRRN